MNAKACCKRAIFSYQGPLIVVAIGIGFILIGIFPFIFTFAYGIRNSATIIGVGFIGFGILLLLPGLIWAIVRRISNLACITTGPLSVHADTSSYDEEEDGKSHILKHTPSFNNQTTPADHRGLIQQT